MPVSRGWWVREQVFGMEEKRDGERDSKEMGKKEKDHRVSNKEETTSFREAPVGKGLGATLKLLQGRGTLNETTELGGRNTDKKKSKLVGIFDGDDKYAEEKKEIRIDRLDEFGRILTPKEAFRRLSHAFHGKGPGKKKQEKHIQQFQEELKKNQMANSETPSMWAERMRDAQAELQTPYLVLSGGKVCRQRSGFATVEKECAGGFGASKKRVSVSQSGEASSNKKPKTRGLCSTNSVPKTRMQCGPSF